MKITDVKTVLLTGPISNDPYLLPLRKLWSAAFVEIHTDGRHMGHSDYEFTWDLDTAKAVLRSLEENDLFLFEEPLPYTDPWGYAELRRSTAIPVAEGEQLTTLPEFRFWAELDSLDVAQLDAGWVGGMEEFVRIAAMFGARNHKIATHGWGAGGVIIQNTHAALAAPNTVILEVPPAAGPLHTEVWGDSFQLRDGYVLPPTAPGLGVRLTEEVKKKHPFQPGTGEFSSVPGKVMST